MNKTDTIKTLRSLKQPFSKRDASKTKLRHIASCAGIDKLVVEGVLERLPYGLFKFRGE